MCTLCPLLNRASLWEVTHPTNAVRTEEVINWKRRPENGRNENIRVSF